MSRRKPMRLARTIALRGRLGFCRSLHYTYQIESPQLGYDTSIPGTLLTGQELTFVNVCQDAMPELTQRAYADHLVEDSSFYDPFFNPTAPIFGVNLEPEEWDRRRDNFVLLVEGTDKREPGTFVARCVTVSKSTGQLTIRFLAEPVRARDERDVDHALKKLFHPDG